MKKILAVSAFAASVGLGGIAGANSLVATSAPVAATAAPATDGVVDTVEQSTKKKKKRNSSGSTSSDQRGS